ncbi:MAG TPA: efflux RND transporter periplasmic adaptor subunit [Thermoanaerobaculia bacterium]|nr:efflux RND transporter periplasmic adaptor subunit [Thermoanaerobaculia bacterium]HUM30312.1 efflux RND transporter periplasmic adaptor subunit [Thermoanaerobaculia bacterium]HXK68537.1 efflux RND transporter periplasmic adaptor subunit [Thermoanaerobaculia bacterium]
MNHSRTLLTTTFFGLLTAVFMMTACKQQQPMAMGPPQVSFVTIQPEPVTLETELPGRTSAYLVAEIRPRVNGIILERAFTEGADVQAGSLLYRIDPEPYQAVYNQAEAALSVAEANLPALRSRSERLRELVAVRAVGEQDAEDAEAAFRMAEANAKAARAALESARINLSYTPITAPISGRIGRSMVTIGAMVTAYQPMPLAVIQQLDPIYVDVPQATTELMKFNNARNNGDLAEGTESRVVRLLLEDGTPYARKGTLKFRDVTVDPTTGSVRLRMVFPNPDHALLPGMFVRAIIQEGTMAEGILAPQQGITRDASGDPIAYLVNAENTVEVRSLKLDRAIGDRWLVTAGLTPGDRLIVEGRQNVRPGSPVTAVPFAPEENAPKPEQPTDSSSPESE